MTAVSDVSSHAIARARWRPAEIAFWILAASCAFLFPSRYLIMTDIVRLALFTLSLDLILGYAGIVSLGHAAFFGVGAYSAGLLALHGIITEPVIALVVAGLVAMVLGFLTSFLVIRGVDLTRLMVTLGIALLLEALAERFSNITGGTDGLQGIEMAPILGLFAFDMFGKTGFFYSLIVLFLLFLLARRIVNSPFGLSLRAIKNNPLRASAIGVPVNRRLIAIYTVAAFYAGIAGALFTQTTALASLDVFSFERSADLMLVLVIGGTGYLYGGLIGAVVFKMLQEFFSTITPQYWQFWIGLVLVVIVLVGRDRMHRWALWLPNLVIRQIAGRKAVVAVPGKRCAMTIALETKGLEKSFGGLKVTRDLSLKVEQGARHALIGPNGAGKTTVINLLTGVLKPNAGRIVLEGNDITDLPVHTRVLRGLSRTFQINQLYADLTPLETVGLAVSERLGRGGDWWRRMGTRDDVNQEIAETLARFHLLDVMNERTATLPYGKQRLLEIAVAIATRPRVLLLDEPAAGVPESERHDILAAVAALPRDVTVLLIEHDMDLVFSFADRISVLVNGAMLVEGPPDEVARDPQVKAVYLGEATDA